jgi:topoisomerase-4 subunit A
MLTRQRGGKSFLALEADEKLLPPAATCAEGQVACLSLSGRLLVFELEELKLQSNGGRGLTLMDLEAKDALVSVAVFRQSLQVSGVGRGGKSKDEVLRPAALESYKGKRARKGKVVEVVLKPQRVLQA